MKFSKIVKKHFSQHSFASKEKLFFYLSPCSCLIDYFSFSFHFTSFCLSPLAPLPNPTPPFMLQSRVVSA